jgi:hypothetical protein
MMDILNGHSHMITGTTLVFMGFTFWLSDYYVNKPNSKFKEGWSQFQTTHKCGAEGVGFFCRKCGVCASDKDLARLQSLIKLKGL